MTAGAVAPTVSHRFRSWRWVALALVAIALIAAFLSRKGYRRPSRFDVIGFVLIATFLGALEVVLDRGLDMT